MERLLARLFQPFLFTQPLRAFGMADAPGIYCDPQASDAGVGP